MNQQQLHHHIDAIKNNPGSVPMDTVQEVVSSLMEALKGAFVISQNASETIRGTNTRVFSDKPPDSEGYWWWYRGEGFAVVPVFVRRNVNMPFELNVDFHSYAPFDFYADPHIHAPLENAGGYWLKAEVPEVMIAPEVS